jgi:hypothetical protein
MINVEDDGYEVLDLVSKKSDIGHVSRMSAFKYHPERTDSANVALRDRGEFNIESIVDAMVDTNMPKRQWSFKIRWEGYDSSFDSWSDWKEVSDNEAVHAYLRKHGLGYYIPPSFQNLDDKNARPKKLKRMKGSRKDEEEMVIVNTRITSEEQSRSREERKNNRDKVLGRSG